MLIPFRRNCISESNPNLAVPAPQYHATVLFTLSRRDWLSAALASAAPDPSIGLIADVQYADQPAAGARAYRDSLTKLAACAEWFQSQHPHSVVQLGDLTDGGERNLANAAKAFESVGHNRLHIIGNHDATIPRATLAAALSLKESWSDHPIGAWRLILLDASDASTMTAALHPDEGRALLDAARAAKSSNAQSWNGGIGSAQLTWLQHSLESTHHAKQRALVFCHQPTLAEACRPEHLLLNHKEVLAALESAGVVAAYFCGHDHRGGYAQNNGIHHVTLKGLVEHQPEECATLVELHSDHLCLRAMDGSERWLALSA